jgi:uncharacterized membrane protein
MEALANGRFERKREEKIGRIIAGIIGAYLLLMLIIPLILSTNSIPELSGRANQFDYATQNDWASWGNNDNGENSKIGHDQSLHGGDFAWSELNPVAAFVYAFGDLNCHQKHERSWEINDNQLAMCTRDIGIMLGVIAGALIWSRRGLNRWTTRDSFLSIFQDQTIEDFYQNDRRLLAMIALCGIGLIPMAIDGFTQLLTSYESTNSIRVITGLSAGLVTGWWFSASFSSRSKYFDGPEQVQLPANAKLVVK